MCQEVLFVFEHKFQGYGELQLEFAVFRKDVGTFWPPLDQGRFIQALQLPDGFRRSQVQSAGNLLGLKAICLKLAQDTEPDFTGKLNKQVFYPIVIQILSSFWPLRLSIIHCRIQSDGSD